MTNEVNHRTKMTAMASIDGGQAVYTAEGEPLKLFTTYQRSTKLKSGSLDPVIEVSRMQTIILTSPERAKCSTLLCL